MINPWYCATLLALEASDVMRLRMTRIAFGGGEAFSEVHLMMTEKIGAAVEALSSMMFGGNAAVRDRALPQARGGECLSPNRSLNRRERAMSQAPRATTNVPAQLVIRRSRERAPLAASRRV